MKIVLAGDNHGDELVLKRIVNDNPVADYYLHVGDSQMPSLFIQPFVSVKGNNDYEFDYPDYRVIDLKDHRIYITHGSWNLFNNNYQNLVYKAKEKECDIVFFGHSHIFVDEVIDGIRIVNPGSTFYCRDRSGPSYAIINIEGKEVTIERIFL